MIRCLRIEGITDLTSSTDATYPPCMTALAFAARIRCCDPLGPAPHSTHSLTNGRASGPPGLDERTSFTAYPMTWEETGTLRTRFCIWMIFSPLMTLLRTGWYEEVVVATISIS